MDKQLSENTVCLPPKREDSVWKCLKHANAIDPFVDLVLNFPSEKHTQEAKLNLELATARAEDMTGHIKTAACFHDARRPPCHPSQHPVVQGQCFHSYHLLHLCMQVY
ncbi:hypothetical protein E5288_WYG001517 [Bos mutus]|uniref:Uncharacterized protein n=1 Tax=Bos mutus TaxID=72004 RepID=A0A6B0RDC1_9CETA|nr:hypothetical protein [Bos mutus]